MKIRPDFRLNTRFIELDLIVCKKVFRNFINIIFVIYMTIGALTFTYNDQQFPYSNFFGAVGFIIPLICLFIFNIKKSIKYVYGLFTITLVSRIIALLWRVLFGNELLAMTSFLGVLSYILIWTLFTMIWVFLVIPPYKISGLNKD